MPQRRNQATASASEFLLFLSLGVYLLRNSSSKNVDYTCWIHLAILWLFEKKKAGMSWPDAIKAYNGSGAQAEHYKAAIVKRAADAASSQAAGTEFIPTH